MPSREPGPGRVVSRMELARVVQRLKRDGRRIVFTNGCFDLLHVGHATLLQRARRLGDVLVVGVNSDRSARGLKGPGRPVVPQRDRARLVASLAGVGVVTLFDEPTPARLVRLVKPDVLVKGADWGPGDIVGGSFVRRRGGRVVRLPLLKGRSTSRLIGRVKHAG